MKVKDEIRNKNEIVSKKSLKEDIKKNIKNPHSNLSLNVDIRLLMLWLEN